MRRIIATLIGFTIAFTLVMIVGNIIKNHNFTAPATIGCPAIVSLEQAIASGGGFTKVPEWQRRGEPAFYIMPIGKDGSRGIEQEARFGKASLDLQEYWRNDCIMSFTVSNVNTTPDGLHYKRITFWVKP